MFIWLAAEFNVHAVQTLHRFWLHPKLIFKRFDKLFSASHIWSTLFACWAAETREIFIADYEAIQDLWLSRNTFCCLQRKRASMAVNSTTVSGLQRIADCTLLRMAERRWPGLFSTAPPLLLIVSLICLLWLWGSPILPYQVEHNISILEVLLLWRYWNLCKNLIVFLHKILPSPPYM